MPTADRSYLNQELDSYKNRYQYEKEVDEEPEEEEEEEDYYGAAEEEDDEDDDDDADEANVDDDDDEEYSSGSHLMPYTLDQIDQRVFIQRVEGKGRCLFARVALKPGDIIFVENPVLAATPKTDPDLWEELARINEEEALSLPPVWHLGAVTSLRKLDLSQQRVIQDKFVPDPEQAPSRDVIRILSATGLALDPMKYERALNAWRFNGFGHHAEDDGLILYNRISNMAHSCEASATWHYADEDAFVLRARRHLAPGDEITISYINDDDLYKPVHIRRVKLSSWQFTCQCRRCTHSTDTCRGFLCPDCAAGTIFLKTDVSGEDEYYTTASTCTVCHHDFDEEEIRRYEELEASYVSRLDDTSKDNLLDAENVYQEAARVFTQHHVMYELDTILYYGYLQANNIPGAENHMKNRIEFLSRASPKVSLTLAGLWEELGDLLSKHIEGQTAISGYHKNKITRCYENAFNSLIVLCGADHEYTIAAHVSLDPMLLC
ncbi:SET domain protein [Gregarina niphandrodes]|uniref:SET domain protein n=1 Tax=Gregarina niphandrodes TaxID=110365 RepID=A0A023B6A5_GRENI|nr:SET domain protein [Gregarina niphandrodes]EZG66172.1 SET domain protein [Gregarina niphandrodes]|eukprot:XP_011134013.1 SET domain protein [Gregarina niphandrodes]